MSMTKQILWLCLYGYQSLLVAQINPPQPINELYLQQAADELEKQLMQGDTSSETVERYRWLLSQIDRKITGESLTIQPASQWLTRGNFTVMMGGGSNLNKAPASKNIEITLADSEKQILELAEQQRPQQGVGVETWLQLNSSKQFKASNKLDLSLQIQHRSTTEQNFTDYLRVNSGVGYRYKRQNTDEIDIALFADVLQYDNETRFYGVNLLGRYTWKNEKPCQQTLGADLQWQHQKNNAVFDKLYTGALAQITCQWSKSLYQLALNGGNEWALSTRPGGHQRSIQLSFDYKRELNWLLLRDQFNTHLNIGYQLDQQGYSPFLENNIHREMKRITVGGQYQLPLTMDNQWWATLKTEWQMQRSNISLFEFNSLEIWLGVNVLW